MRKFISYYLLRKKIKSGISNATFRLILARPTIYMVRLLFKTDSPVGIGDTLPIAIVLYARKKSRLRSRPEIDKQFNEFLREYHELKQYSDFLHECRELSHVELLTKRRVSLFKTVCIQPFSIICVK